MIWNENKDEIVGIESIWLNEIGKERIEYVNIVRCKDCKHGKKATNAKGEYMIDCLLADNWLKYPDWFCADGRRKE